MIRHRFIVSGAFQALNAVEARSHFGFDPDACELVFLEPPQAHAADEARWLIARSGWPHVRAIGPPNDSFGSWVRKVRNARGLIDESRDLDHLVLGDYQTQVARHAGHGVGHGRVVVLDDGLATIRINDHRRAAQTGHRAQRLHPQVPRLRYEAQRTMARGLGLRIADLPAVTYFSLYALDVGPADAVVRNRFAWIRRRFGQPEVVDGVLFLGSPLVESGILPAELYERLLGRLRDGADGPIWYRPHPREEPARVAALAGRLGLELLDIPTVVEYGILSEGWVPATVAANHSTTLDTMRVLFGDDVAVRSVPVPVDAVPRRWKPFIRAAYADLDRRLGEPVERLELL